MTQGTNILYVRVAHVTPRVRYMVDRIFHDRLGLIVHLVGEQDAVPDSSLVISYGTDPIDGVPFIAAAKLLFETGIKQYNLTWTVDPVPMIFTGIHRGSELPFDPLAASFYLLSRYEEYNPYVKDEHGRFSLSQSILRHNDLHMKPLVEIWAAYLGDWLCRKFGTLRTTRPAYRFVPTYDIDVPYAYRLKGIFRTIGGFSRSAATLSFAEIRERCMVLSGRKPDPFDTYDYQWQLQEKYGLEPVYFVLFGTYGEYDKNPSIHNPAFISLIKRLRDHAPIGIHPSYRSCKAYDVLVTEVKDLAQVINEPVSSSRQHYIKIEVPVSYQRLARAGVYNDYSMGFPEAGGFRAGTSIPFPFYDLDYEVEIPVMVHPFILMDGTLRDYLGLDPQKAIDFARELNKPVREYGGNFTTLWHNESLSDKGRWAGWRNVYEQVIEMATAS